MSAPGPISPAAPPLPDSLESAVARWPADRPLAAFGIGPDSPWSRWAVLAEPTGETLRIRSARDIPAAFERLFTPRSGPDPSPDAPPFVGGWIGCLGYPLGRLLEPRATLSTTRAPDRDWPAAFFHRCDRAWVYDKLRRRWRRVGPDGGGSGFDPAAPEATLIADPPRSGIGAQTRYEERVARVLEYIRAGDIYQANLAHRLTALFEGSTRAALQRLLASEPWYGAFMTDDEGGRRRAVVSASPELFFRYDARSKIITTRPMKGTRPAGGLAELAASPKDRAELAMIVDLMRNDLGRVCEFGTVRVDQDRTIESHGEVLQAVSSISGRLRNGLGLAEVIRALFPGGSITGAPKIRAMQIIEELEEADRGPYCGAIGFVSDSGDACFSMAIRTLAISGTPGPGPDAIAEGLADYWAGAGIVADSEPASEWAETLVKTAPLRRAFPTPGEG